MKIYYQWKPGAYSHKASIQISSKIGDIESQWVDTFEKVFERIQDGQLGMLPIENSYAGSVHTNLYELGTGEYKILSDLYLPINHCLLGNADNIADIEKVYSHYQALIQCSDYIQDYNFEKESYKDTAGSAKFVKKSEQNNIASISSSLAAKIYNLNVLEKDIQDQDGNTTRFFLVKSKDTNLDIDLGNVEKSNKLSVIFETKHVPSALYKCLWAFATRNINLTKIESMPAKEDPFDVVFWLDIEKNQSQKELDEALEELNFFCENVVKLWGY